MTSIRKILMKLAADASSDLKLHKKALIAAGSIAAGFLGLMLLPVAVLSALCDIEPPSYSGIDTDSSAYLSQLAPEQEAQLADTEADGNAVAEAMAKADLAEQTIKAQLIYMSFFDDDRLADFEEYAGFFVYDNEQLIPALNEKYGLEIDYAEFMRTYTIVMNSTINEYMFQKPEEKNIADLAAWCRNAYISQWRYAENTFGERSGEDSIRCADNVGLIAGYIRYDTASRTFASDTSGLRYIKRGKIGTIPDFPGIGVYNGTEFGVYVGGGQVIFSSAIGDIQQQALADGNWTTWCTFEGITFPKEVKDHIDEYQNPTERPSAENAENGE